MPAQTTQTIRLRAKLALCVEFGGSDVRFFAFLLGRALQLNDCHDRLFRDYLSREARFAYLLAPGV